MLNLQIDVPEYAKSKEKSGIIYQGGCLNFRFDGLDGLFYLGSEVVGDYIKVRPFAYRWDSGMRWGRVTQSWLDVAFLSPNNVVSIISFKKNSAINIATKLAQIETRQIDLLSTILTISAVEDVVRVLDDCGFSEDSYRSVAVTDIAIVPEAEMLELKAFVDSKVFEWHLVGEV